MDEEKHQSHQPLSIFNWFFKFIMKSLSSNFLKLVNLGRRMNCSMPPAPRPPPTYDAMPGNKNNQIAKQMAQGTSKECEILSEPSSPGSLRNNGVKDNENLAPVQGSAVNVESYSPQPANKENGESHTDAVKSEENAPEPSIVPHPNAPEKAASIRKTVSINDRVEEMDKIMKQRKKSKSFEKLNSSTYEEDEPKPLRSILKVGSNLDEKTDTSG